MPSIDDLNALNIRPRTYVRIRVYDNSGSTQLVEITQDNLIRATVSLRSDLSRIGPTLPESEIEVEAYFETDISDALADAGEELQVRYIWYPVGTTGGETFNRYFYTDERVTWADKILHIHAVDQVNKLDEELPPMYIGQDWYWNNSSISDHNVLHNMARAFSDWVRGTRDSYTGNIRNITVTDLSGFQNEDGIYTIIPEGGALNMLQPRMTRREAIAKMMNLCRWDFDAGALNTKTNFWPTYVDAGRPRARFTRPTDDPITIKREDCGDVKESKEPVFSSITAIVSDVQWIGAGEFDEINDSNMKSQILKYQGITFAYSGYGDHYVVGIPNDPSHPWGMRTFYIRKSSDDNNARKRPPQGSNNNASAIDNNYGKWLLDDNVATNAWTPEDNTYSYLDLSGSKWYQPLDPDVAPTETPDSIWNECVYYEDIPTDAETVNAANWANYFLPTASRRITKSRAGSGAGYTIQDEMFLMGHAKMRRYDDTGEINLLPDAGINHLLDMSNVVGSFTWKGDPRLQPRDFVNFVYADGELTDENDFVLQTADGDDIIINQSKIITIENITTTHERGGTICEITYREGYC